MDNEKYYENFDWVKFDNANENYSSIRKLIPKDVNSIIDIGCGNGLITNKLNSEFEITGVDRSAKALELVTTHKIQASCDNIPVENNSFDLVLSSELLEHLDDSTFSNTISEINRISNKYILISVPFEESLNKGMIQCPSCSLIFHRCYHMRTFSLDSIANNFPNYELIDSKIFGLKVRVYNNFIGKIKHKLTSPVSWIPLYWTKNEDRSAMCPSCENKFNYSFKFNFISFTLDCINVLITKKKPFHLVVLLRKKKEK
jgi:SAM-dependent methyltransferase